MFIDCCCKDDYWDSITHDLYMLSQMSLRLHFNLCVSILTLLHKGQARSWELFTPLSH